MLHATNVRDTPGLSFDDGIDQMIYWNQQATENGNGVSMVKLARAYEKYLDSPLPLDPEKARSLYQKAVDVSNSPDGNYGLAFMYLKNATQLIFEDFQSSGKIYHSNTAKKLIHLAVSHLEDAALRNHPFSMFNLGLAHLFGYGYYNLDEENRQYRINLAGDWFEASGLPEGYMAKSMHASSVGNEDDAEHFRRSAEILGFGSQWRKIARERTGSGGASGVTINMPWPPLSNGNKPPEW